MDAGAVGPWSFGTACELLFGECMSSVSHGQHRLVRSPSNNRARGD